MDKVKDSDLETAKGMSDDAILSLYEDIRAAEKQDREYPYATERAEVKIDWDALEKRALDPSWPESLHAWIDSISARAVAFSIVLPILGMFATFFWLGDIRVEASGLFVMQLAGATVVMVLMFIWAWLSVQALERWSPATAGDASETTPVVSGSGPRFQLKWMVPGHFSWSHATAWTCVIAVVASVIVNMGLRPRKGELVLRQIATASVTDPVVAASLNEAALDYLFTGNVERGGQNLRSIVETERTNPVEHQEDLLKAADLPYRRLMRLSSSDPRAAKQREELTAQTIAVLKEAANVDPNRAEVWTRLAEVYFQKGDVEEAKRALDNVKKNAPPHERARALMIAGVIRAYDVTALAKTEPSPEERQKVSGELAEQIREMKEATQAEVNPLLTQAEANPVLTQLHLARAAIAENEDERAESERAAIDLSLIALGSPLTSVRSVERPIAIARVDSVSSEQKLKNAQGHDLVPTSTTRDQ